MLWRYNGILRIYHGLLQLFTNLPMIHYRNSQMPMVASQMSFQLYEIAIKT